jgi:hypothetical protein
MFRAISIVIFAAMSWFTAPAAHAGTVWSIPGSGCIPADDTVAAGTYNTAGSYIDWAGSTTGDIHLTCPVTLQTATTVTTFDAVLYGNGSGTSQFYVQVTLRRASDFTSTDICTIVQNPSGTATSTCNFTDFTLDINAYYYYFYVRIHRDNSTLDNAFGGVRLHD